MSTRVGSIHYDLSIESGKFDSAVNGVKGKLGDLENKSKGMNDSFVKTGVVMGAVAGVVQNVFSRAVDSLSRNMDTAIRRVDTLNNSQRTFANMGFKADEAKEATKRLDESIRGLPTSLDDAMRGMTGLAATYGSLKTGQEVFSALNNAILGFGGSSDMVNNAITQLSQLPMDGPLDAQTWNSLRNSGLTPVLVAIAKDMGLGVNEMKKKFGEGELTVKDFTDALVKMNKEGGGGMQSLTKIAKDSTSGIQTGMANMQTAIARGLAAIIQAIGQKNISDAITAMGKAMESALKGIVNLIEFVVKYRDIFAPIAVGIATVVAAMATWKAITAVVTAAQVVFNAVLTANPIGVIVMAIAALVAGLIYFFTQTETGKKIMEIFFKFMGDAFNNLTRWGRDAWQSITGFFNTAGNNISNFVNNIVNWFKSLPHNIGNALKNIGNFITAPFRSAFNFISDAWNNTVGRLSWKAPDWVPGIGGKSISAPKLPRFANGVRDFAGGWAMVGEQGPELVNLPKGSSVFSAQESQNMVGHTFNIGTINDRTDMDYLINRIDMNQRMQIRGVAPL